MEREVPQLPADIMAYITYRADIPTAQRSLISKGVEGRSRLYLKEDCEQPISQNEYTKYVEKGPSLVGFFHYNMYEPPSESILDVSVLININIIDQYTGLLLYINMDDSDINYYTDLSSDHTLDLNESDLYIPDVLTSYRIYKERLNCMRISPIFAKDLTLKNFLYELDELETLTDNKKFFLTHLYLYMNAYVLNILTPKPKLESNVLLGDDAQPLPNEMNRTDVKPIISQIPILKEQILKAIEKFD